MLLEIEGLRKRYGGTVAHDSCTAAPKPLAGLANRSGRAGSTRARTCTTGPVSRSSKPGPPHSEEQV
ncbi:hypothetical protein GCM10010530_21150 [Kribbella aluminosa]